MSGKRERSLSSDDLGKAARKSSLLKRSSAISVSDAPSPSDFQDLLTLRLLVEQQRLQLERQDELILQLQREKKLRDQEQQRLLLQSYHEQQLRLQYEARLRYLGEHLRLTANQLNKAQEIFLEPIHSTTRAILPKPSSDTPTTL